MKALRSSMLMLLLFVAPSFAQEPTASTSWSSLSPQQQLLLSNYQGRWDSLPAERQQALARGSARWAEMSPAQRSRAQERFSRWRSLPAEERKVLRERWNQFQQLAPDEQVVVRQNFRKFRSLPPEQRRALRERWQQATPVERRNMLERSRTQRPNRRP